MKTTAVRQRQTYNSVDDYEENCYLFSPSIQRQKTVKGKPYYVRSYFSSGQDFEKTMKQLAVKQTYKKVG